MKKIVISGARSDVGKTTLAERLCRLLPGAVHVKIGHGTRRKGKTDLFFQKGTPFRIIAERSGEAPFLVIESNSILSEIDPECTIYLPADNPKETAGRARSRADIIRGTRPSREDARRIAGRLGIPVDTMEKMIELVETGSGRDVPDDRME
jgi:hypothetical protein